MHSKIIITLIVSLLVFSCNKYEEEVKVLDAINSQAGVVITFDDNYINQWYKANTLLKKYNWKATFFISQFNTLTNVELRKLQSLKNQGNEIGGHGWIHLKAAPFEKHHGETDYLDKEILPMLKTMNEKSLAVHSFAYPYGSRSAVTDTILLKEFNIIRGTTYGKEAPSKQRCYFNNSRVLFGLGIDNSYAQYSIPYFISLLKYAKENNKIVIFYAHKPVYKARRKYETEYKTLTEICKYVKENNMKFYTVSDLYLKEFRENRTFNNFE